MHDPINFQLYTVVFFQPLASKLYCNSLPCKENLNGSIRTLNAISSDFESIPVVRLNLFNILTTFVRSQGNKKYDGSLVFLLHGKCLSPCPLDWMKCEEWQWLYTRRPWTFNGLRRMSWRHRPCVRVSLILANSSLPLRRLRLTFSPILY